MNHLPTPVAPLEQHPPGFTFHGNLLELEDDRIYDPHLIAAVAFDWDDDKNDYEDFRLLLTEYALQRGFPNNTDGSGWPGSVWKTGLDPDGPALMRQDFVSEEKEAWSKKGREQVYARLVLRLDPFRLYTAEAIVKSLNERGMEDLKTWYQGRHSDLWLMRELSGWLQELGEARLGRLWDARICLDGENVEPAWYGFRWCLTLSKDVMAESERLALEKKVADWEWRRRGALTPVKRKYYQFAVLALVVFLLSWVALSLKYLPFEVARRPKSIAVLACYKDHMGPVIQDMLIGCMESYTMFKPLSSQRIESKIGTAGFCEPLSEQMTLALFHKLKVDYLLLGGMTSGEDGYRWRGELMRKDGKKRAITVVAGHYRTLTDEIGKRCLAFLGSGETPVSAIDFYSSNMNASLLFAEGNAHFENGNIRAASALYERACTVYDPEFHPARIRWAQCLRLMGDLTRSAEVLEGVRDLGETVDPMILSRACRSLAQTYYDARRMADLEGLLNGVRNWAHTNEDHLFFQLMTIRLRLSMDEDGRAETLLDALRDQVPDGELATDLLWTRAWMRHKKGDDEGALSLLEDALAQARILGDSQKETTVLGEIARIQLNGDDLVQLRDTADQLERMVQTARKTGLVIREVGASYWLAHCLAVLGEPDRSVRLWEAAVHRSGVTGLLDEEVRARISLAQFGVRTGTPEKALTYLAPLQPRLDQLTPRQKSGFLDILARSQSSAGAHEAALETYDLKLSLTQEMGWEARWAAALNDKGYVYEQMKALDLAEACYGKAHQWLEAHDAAQGSQVLGNLLRVLTAQGKLEEARALRALPQKEGEL